MNVEIVFTKTAGCLGMWNTLPPVLVAAVDAPKEFDAPFIKDEPETDSDDEQDEQSLTPHYSRDATPFVPSPDMFSHTCGMINRGLDCYINNVFQCLLSFPEFVGRFMGI
jgi:hypothetical protein